MKNSKIFPVLFAVLMLFVFTAPAIAEDLDGTTCNTMVSGSWFDNTCTVSVSKTTTNLIIIPAGITLKIAAGGSITTNNIIQNFGNIIIEYGGAITNDNGILNGGGWGSLSGTGTGTITNAGTITNSGFFFNGGGALGGGGGIGTITNTGTITNSGEFLNGGGYWDGSGGGTGTITNAGTITNSGEFLNGGGSLGGGGGIGTIINKCGGIFNGNPPDPNDIVQETPCTSVPEFPTVALPVIAVIGLMFLFQRRKGN